MISLSVDEAWDWLLPSTKGTGLHQTVLQEGEQGGKSWRRVGKVTADDIGSLCFKLTVSTPDGFVDQMHIIAAIVADAETLPAGTDAPWYVNMRVYPLPASVSQRAASTWVGDVGKAAADWTILGRMDAKADYMRQNAPPHDLLADIDGVAMTSKSPASGFAFDKTAPLSNNLRLFSRSGRKSRFHIFCNVEGFTLEADGVTLTSEAKSKIEQSIGDFALWYAYNDPTLASHTVLSDQNSFVYGKGRRL